MALFSDGSVLVLAFYHLVLVGILVSGWSLFLLWVCKPYSSELRSESTAGRSLSPGRLCTEGCGVSRLPGANSSRKTPKATLIKITVNHGGFTGQRFNTLPSRKEHGNIQVNVG